MSIYHLHHLFDPRSIAVVRPQGEAGGVLLENLRPRGNVYLVDPEGKGLGGFEAYPSLTSIPRALDLVVLAGPVETLWEDLEDALRKKAKTLVILARDFRTRVSDFGTALAKLSHLVNKHRVRILGPNTLGFMRPPLKLNVSTAPFMPVSGNLAFLSDSSTLASALLDWAVARKVGFSFFVSLGEKVDVDLADVIDYLALDYRTRALVIYLEHIKNARKFIGAARAFSRTKPIMVVKNGRFLTEPEQEVRVGEIASLITEDMIYEAALRRAGIVRVEEVLELFYVAEGLSKQPRPIGPSLAIISNAGGPALSAVDTLKNYGGELATFPQETLEKIPGLQKTEWLDLLSDASPSSYHQALRVCLQEKGVDGVVVICTPETGVSSEEIAWAVVKASRGAKKPVLCCFMGMERMAKARDILKEANIPHFTTPEETVKSFLYMFRYDHLLRLLFETPGTLLEEELPQEEVLKIIRKAAQSGRYQLFPEESLKILSLYGIEGKDFLSQPYPLFLSMFKDKTFGAVIGMGLGGPLAKAVKDFALGLPPLNQTLARRLLEQLKLYSFLKDEGFPVEILEEILVKFSHLIIDFPEIQEIEINPLLFGKEGLKIERVSFHLEGFAALPRQRPYGLFCPQHLSICPYPSHLVFEFCLKDGTLVKLRPIKPEDEPLMAQLFYSLSTETIRYRFMQLKRNISHEELVRYCQIDYDRELALVALVEENGKREIIGVVRLIKRPDERSAEIAIVVADKWQGKGLGSLLMNQILMIAKDLRLTRLEMEILQENVKMLKLAQKFGFQIKKQEEDLLQVVLEL